MTHAIDSITKRMFGLGKDPAAKPAATKTLPAGKKKPVAVARKPLPARKPIGAKRLAPKETSSGAGKAGIRKLARRGGVKRISGSVYDETRGVLRAFLEGVVRDSVAYSEHARRKTVTTTDVVFALKRRGYPLYGYE